VCLCVCLIVCDLETSTVRRFRIESGRLQAETRNVKRKLYVYIYIYTHTHTHTYIKRRIIIQGIHKRMVQF
jgi:hypothetical protein